MNSRDVGTQYKLRLPEDLKEKISGIAKQNNRSMNLEIVARLEESFEKKGIELRDNEMIIDKTLYQELLGMRQDLLKMSKMIYEGFAPAYEDIKILTCENPTNKPIRIGSIIRLHFTFGQSNNHRYGDFKVIELNGENGVAELFNVPTDPDYFESYEEQIGKKYNFNLKDIYDARELTYKPKTEPNGDWG